MSIQEKEKIKELNRKVKDLEAVIQQKDELLGDYQSIEKIADGTIPQFPLTFHRENQRFEHHPRRESPLPHELHPAAQKGECRPLQAAKGTQAFRAYPTAQ